MFFMKFLKFNKDWVEGKRFALIFVILRWKEAEIEGISEQ